MRRLIWLEIPIVSGIGGGTITHSRTTSAFEVELAIEKLKSHKSPDIAQIPGELSKAGAGTIHSEIHKLIISIWNKEILPEEWKESIIVLIYKNGNKTDLVIIGTSHSFIQHPAVKVNSICRGNYWGSM